MYAAQIMSACLAHLLSFYGAQLTSSEISIVCAFSQQAHLQLFIQILNLIIDFTVGNCNELDEVPISKCAIIVLPEVENSIVFP